MFKKKPQIKPLAPLRSSDRRKTADQIISDLGLEKNTVETANPEEKVVATAEHTALRNSILPDNCQSARFTTTHGPDLRQVSGTVYVASHEGGDQRVLWVKIEDRMYPSVYTLWHNPRIVPLLHTHEPVVEKLRGGADLMTPGLANGPPFPERAKRGTIVAVASTEAPTVPVAVGVCEIDVGALKEVRGAKGHAVQNMHWDGDELWAWSATGKSGGKAPGHIEGWLGDTEGDQELTRQTEDLDLDQDGDSGGVALGGGRNAAQGGPDVANGVDGDVLSREELVEEVDIEMTTKEIDDAFRNAFIYGVYHYIDTNKSDKTHGLDLPLQQSFVMSHLVQPFLPIFTPSQQASLQIKKTSWKNIKKFMKSLDKEKLIKTKDKDGNEVFVWDIDFEDPVFRGFTPYRLPKKETADGTSAGRGDKATTASDTSDASVGQKLTQVTVFKPKDKLSELFTTIASDPKGFYNSTDLRNIVTSYIEHENLIFPTNKRLVKLNPFLSNAIFDGSDKIDKEVNAKGTVARDALIERIQHACAPHHYITTTATIDSAATSKPRPGAAPRVTITLETRSGNKTVTKVSGVESYYIPPQPLADELRKSCAGATSVEKLAGSSNAKPVMEIMVQGPQRDAVLRALERRGVLGRWVDVVDKVKKKK